MDNSMVTAGGRTVGQVEQGIAGIEGDGWGLDLRW